jgi:hypothetical protein
MTRIFLILSATILVLLTYGPLSFAQYCPINIGPAGVIEGIGNTSPAGSRVSIINDLQKGEEPPDGGFVDHGGETRREEAETKPDNSLKPKDNGGFVSHGDGETRVVEDKPEPNGGFKPHEGGETRVVEGRPEPYGGFKPISGETTSLTRRPPQTTQRRQPRSQSGWVRSNDGIDDDFNDPTFGDAYVVPRYVPTRPNRTWRPTARPSRGSGWTGPRRQSAPVRTVSPRGPSQRGGVGFMREARPVSPDRARQLQRSFR